MPVVSEHPEWKVILFNVQTGLAVGEMAPKNLSASIYLGNVDVGAINFDINLSHPLARKQYLEANATDFILMHKDHHILGGTIDAVNVTLGEEWISIAGSGFLNYFSTRFWPFDPADPGGNVLVEVDTDSFTILTNILDVVLAEGNSLEMDYNLGTSGIPINYRIEPADTESILEKIKDVSEQEPGFDYEIHSEIMDGMIHREFMAYAPGKGQLNDYSFEEGRNIKDLSYTHGGVKATHVLGTGAGTTQRIAAVSNDVTLEAKYRRRDHTIDFGDIIDLAVVQRQTDAEMVRMSKSVRTDIRATIIPEPNVDIWTVVPVGDTCQIICDCRYEDMSESLKVVGYEINPTDQGDEEVTVIFEDAQV
jgi:hypothetical protein